MTWLALIDSIKNHRGNQVKAPLSDNTHQNSSKKSHRSFSEIATKIVVYRELVNASRSQREASKILKIPRATFQEWIKKRKTTGDIPPEVVEFFQTPHGSEYLHRLILAAEFVINEIGGGGIGQLQQFLHLTKLDQIVASSIGTLHALNVNIENQIIVFGNEQVKRLGKKMILQKVKAAFDETFHGGKPCLVAMELNSNYILCERYAEKRDVEEWSKAVKEGTSGLNISIDLVTGDGGTAITSYAKNELGAKHSPDLFHVQQEFTRATAGPLNAQEKEFVRAERVNQKKMNKHLKKFGEGSEEANKAKGDFHLSQHGLERRKRRRNSVKEAIKNLGKIYHPVNIETGRLQSAQRTKERLFHEVQVIEQAAEEAQLSESCLKRIRKGKGSLASMKSHLTFFFIMLYAWLDSLQLTPELRSTLLEVIIPCMYLEKIAPKADLKEEKARLLALADALKSKTRDGPWIQLDENTKKTLLEGVKECLCNFQRSSSCVEGRNGTLSLRRHSLRGLSDRKLNVLTILHNFHIRRRDYSTAAERFFKKTHEDLFEWLLPKIKPLGAARHGRRKRELLAA